MTANDSFFDEDKKSAAILKHGVLTRYLAKFAGATSSTSPGGRVGYLDGYAGEGSYTNPRTQVVSEGSPAIALRIARDQARAGVELHCTLVERDRAAFEALTRVVDEYDNPHVVTFRGDLNGHLDDALATLKDMPALVFIDPFGTGPNAESTIEKILKRPGAAPTELLLNFSVQAARRMGARLREAEDAPGRARTLERMDSWLGGSWWREVYDSEEIRAVPESERPHAAAMRIAAGYRSRIARATSCAAFTVPIRRKPSDKELFWLTLFCPRRVALWYFNEAVSLALRDWRAFLADVELAQAEHEDEATLGVFSRVNELKDVFRADEEQINLDAVASIREAVTSALSRKPRLSTRSDIGDIFGDALGIGRETHLRTAWKQLASEGFVAPPPTGKLSNATITLI